MICKNSMIPKIFPIEIWSVAARKKLAAIDPDSRYEIAENAAENLFYINDYDSMRGIGNVSSWSSLTSLNCWRFDYEILIRISLDIKV